MRLSFCSVYTLELNFRSLVSALLCIKIRFGSKAEHTCNEVLWESSYFGVISLGNLVEFPSFNRNSVPASE